MFTSLGQIYDSVIYKINEVIINSGIITYADSKPAGGGDGGGKITAILTNIMSIFPWIGIIFAFVGGFKLLMAFRNDQNPEGIAGGAKDLVIGVALILFQTLLGDALIGLLTK